MDRQFHINNRARLMDQLPECSLVIQFAGQPVRRTADDEYPFFANRNFLYTTGIDASHVVYMGAKGDQDVREWIFIREPDHQKEIWTGRRPTIDEVHQRSGVDDILYRSQFDEHLHRMIQSGQYDRVYLDLDMHQPGMTDIPSQRFARDLRKQYPQMQIGNIYPILKRIRTYKTEGEIDNLRQAVQLTKQGLNAMMQYCRPGMMEYQLEAVFKHTLAMQGCREPAFKPIISYGENNFYLHYDQPYGQIGDEHLVLCDVGAVVDGYCADISRVFPANGVFSKLQRDVYQVAYDAVAVAQDAAGIGCTFQRFNDVARQSVADGLGHLGLIQSPEDVDRYMIHKIAHHIGLDVHDVGIYDVPMAENMVFTLDVGIYIPEWHVGLRIEDDVLVTKDGIENLADTVGIVKEVDAIEDMLHPSRS